MSYTLLIHMIGEDPVVAEVEELPGPSDQVLVCNNARRRDGRDIHYILPEATTILFPWHRIHCVEVLPAEGEEEIVSFIRE